MPPANTLLWYPPAEARLPLADILAAALNSATASGDLATAISARTGVVHCILAGCAKSLLYLLLMHLRARHGNRRDEVLIPGYTCYTVAAAIAKAGLKIRVYDIDPTSLHADIDSLGAGINDATLAVISQHLFGLPLPVDGIQQLTTAAGIAHIEDAAQAFGSTLSGQAAGKSGDYGLYSFGRGKALPVGGGGALISNDAAIHEFAPSGEPLGIKALVTRLVIQATVSPLLYWLPEMLPLGLGETVFDPMFTPAAMPKFLQRLALCTMRHLQADIGARLRITEIYNSKLASGVIVPDISAEVNAIRYPLLAGTRPISARLHRLGVRRMYPRAICDVAAIAPYMAPNQAPTPGSREVASMLITLPTHRGISPRLAATIAAELS